MDYPKARRFQINPGETSFRRRKNQGVKGPEDKDEKVENPVPTPATRRFLPVPMETSYRSSKIQRDKVPEGEEADIKEDLPKPTSRKFLPAPVETSFRSSSKQGVKGLEDEDSKFRECVSTPDSRRFLPVPVETSYRSSKSREGKALPEDDSFGAKKSRAVSVPKTFLPEPIETSFHSYRQNRDINVPFSCDYLRYNSKLGRDISPSKPANSRRFVPQLIETSKRSKRVGDSRPATLLTDKTDLTPGVPNIYTSFGVRVERKLLSNRNNAIDTTSQPHQVPFKPRRQCSIRPHLNTRYPSRQASFTSNLDTISSSESESISSTPLKSQSLTSSLSEFKESKESRDFKDEALKQLQLSRTRESCDDRFSGYLLALAAKAAEKQLKEQALLAAFPNESNHEIIEHFYTSEIEATSDNDSLRDVDAINTSTYEVERIGRSLNCRKPARKKSSDSSWAIKEMQLHKDKVLRLQKDQREEEKLSREIDFPFQTPFWTEIKVPQVLSDNDSNVGKELQKMRNAASPPMLGSGLKFRICPSPKLTKFESDQKINIKVNRSENGGGLWGGFCVAEEPGEYISQSFMEPSFIHTPSPRENFSDPFVKEFGEDLPWMVENQKSSSIGLGAEVKSMNETSKRSDFDALKSQKVEGALKEFDDHFITQVYNYLSLGYPSVAWQFDEELSRISKISVEELKQDDQIKTQGHIGLKVTSPKGQKTSFGTDFDSSQNIDESQKCSRWRALKIYILEWGRQHPSLNQAVLGHGAWGMTVRKGSWAF
ncbi:hypothetical protein GcM1_235107 [Golovinomyces cichoracearum]|uniref:Uncharacterized protein n=1 Tax=Golovinomyces cichoracearum TaxID=62708 RepID=A0A420IL32_9PEZI|nr:hypothetical protein GcM1_235107 [Golovinomyces cichoracearum]